jgi:hypothetical protein
LIVPQAVPLQLVPDTVQATAVFEVPVTEATNCWVAPAVTDTLAGVTLMTTAAKIVRLADADLDGSATLVAITPTVAGECAKDGAVNTAEFALDESVPQEEPLQPVPLRPQVTAVFEVPVTLAVRGWTPATGTSALVGLMLINTESAARIVTLAEADFVGSATLVAFTVTVAGEGTLAGGAYSPLPEIVPHAALTQPAPLTLQATSVFEVPITFAKNCWVFPIVTEDSSGITVIVIGVELTVRVAMLLVTLPVELLTATPNSDPLSELEVAAVVYVAEFAPLIYFPFLSHW